MCAFWQIMLIWNRPKLKTPVVTATTICRATARLMDESICGVPRWIVLASLVKQEKIVVIRKSVVRLILCKGFVLKIGIYLRKKSMIC